jgi:cytochrome bd-type quinol oxidase subunit 2
VSEQSEQADHEPPRAATRSGPGRVLIAVYAVFALAATARSVVQIATKFQVAPLAYVLSAIAAVVYIVATVCFVRGTRMSRLVATVSCSVELVGVLAVGTASVLYPTAFPDATVWSVYGQGYGYVPVVLPVLGLLWIRHLARVASPV